MMSSARRTIVFLSALALVGCHKKSQATAAEGGAAASTDNSAASDASAADSAPAADDAAAEAATAPADAAAGDDGGGEAGTDQGDDGGAAPSEAGPTTVTTGGAGYGGSFNCFGVLNLTQTNTTVVGTGSSRSGNKTHNVDINCRVSGDRCSGAVNHFSSLNNSPPKPAGKGKITFRIVNGGLEYTEASGGTGFCARR
jgi:hypothetical protein